MAYTPKMAGPKDADTEILEYSFVPWEYHPEGPGPGKVTATIARYGDMSNEEWGVQIVERGAFDKGLHRTMTVNRMHQLDQMIARTGVGLTLIEDADALRCEIALPATFYGRMVAEELQAGVLQGLCPEFTIPDGGAWYEPFPNRPGVEIRHVTEAHLWAIGFVDIPGLPDSGITSWEHYLGTLTEWPAYHDRVYGYKVLGTILK